MAQGVEAELRRLVEAIRARRMELGWSQEQLGEEAGLHRTYIGKLERGEIDLSFTRAVRIAWALGCKLSELYEE